MKLTLSDEDHNTIKDHENSKPFFPITDHEQLEINPFRSGSAGLKSNWTVLHNSSMKLSQLEAISDY
jgi:hypothetical protein